MDGSDKKIDVWYPIGSAGQKFPFIAYAHGDTFGGRTTVFENGKILTAMSAFGYIIAAGESCDAGCNDLATLPFDPPGFKNYYKQQLLVIDFAKQQAAAGDTVFKNANLDIGVGI